jgi:transcription elongation factor GreA
MKDKQIKVTQEGFATLKLELEELINKKRPAIVTRLERARNEGDLSENSDYTNAREELDFIDGRIDELKHVVENAVVQSNGASSKKSGKVDVGNKVKVKTNGSEHVFHIVGEWEANPLEKKISHESPLGKALTGSKVGDTVEVEAPAGMLKYQILEIE